MRNAQAYLLPHSLDEAVAMVRARPGRAAYLGGGTALAVRDDSDIEALVDLAPLGLDGIETGPEGARIGAMVRLEHLRRSPLAATGNGILHQALCRTRSTAWRNQATLGGRLRDGDAVDLIGTVLQLFAATCTVQSAAGVAPVAVAISEVAALPVEALLIRIDIPALRGWRFALEAFQETALAPPLVAVGVGLELDTGGVVRAARVATCGVTERPARAGRLEAALGSAPAASLREPGRYLLDADIHPADDWRASAVYRAHLAHVALVRALHRALAAEAVR